MLSYQHTYHAGNHADVFKHIILSTVLAGMQHKETGIMLLDAFAGRGLYDLSSEHAEKTDEMQSGIAALWPLKQSIPAPIRRWKQLIKSYNIHDALRYYPGSTALFASMKRPQDRLLACDLHPQEFTALRQNFPSQRGFSLHKKDAYEALRAFLPPKEKRGLVFLDPSFEDKSEYQRIADAVIQAYAHFRAGVFVIWYPLLPAQQELDMLHTFQDSGIRKILRLEASGNFPDMQMQGSGLLIINPPWHAEQAMQQALAWIQEAHLGAQGNTLYRWLVPE